MDLLLLGCGHAHVEVLRQFGRRPLPGLRLTLVSPGRHTPYSGMLPGVVAGRYRPEEMHIDVVRLAAFAGARLVLAAAEHLDPAARLVRCDDGTMLRYDRLSLDIGAEPDLAAIPGAAEHATPVKPISGLLARWAALERQVLAQPGPARLAVIGAGPAGVELAFALRHRLPPRIAIALIGDAPEVTPAFPPRARARLRARLEARGVTLHLGAPVARITPGLAHREGQPPLPFDGMLVATPVVAAPWLAASGLACDTKGFVQVNEWLQSVSHPEVFAAGDVATMEGHPRAKSGVVAVRSGPPLAANLRRVVEGRPLRRFVPQRTWLNLLNTADGAAIAVRGPFLAEGRWVWWWKDWIDRRFIGRFSQPGRSAAAAAAPRADRSAPPSPPSAG